MDVVKASTTFHADVLRVFVEPAIMEWIVDPLEEDLDVVLFLEVDDAEAPEPRETGRIAGIEIVGFLDFDRWATLPELPLLWQLPGWEPLPLPELLKRLQVQLRARAETAATAPRHAAS